MECLAPFQAHFPRVSVDPEALYVQGGRLGTLAGVTAGIDLALAMVVHDLIPDLCSLTNGYLVDKIDGMTFATDGSAWVIADNGGVDDRPREMLFWSFGKL